MPSGQDTFSGDVDCSFPITSEAGKMYNILLAIEGLGNSKGKYAYEDWAPSSQTQVVSWKGNVRGGIPRSETVTFPSDAVSRADAAPISAATSSESRMRWLAHTVPSTPLDMLGGPRTSSAAGLCGGPSPGSSRGPGSL